MNIDFLTLWKQAHADDVTAEHQFAPPRRWRFDFAWPAARIAVEFDGGQWVANGGRHNRDSDREKINHAAAMGWRVLRFSNQQWATDPHGCVSMIEWALAAPGGGRSERKSADLPDSTRAEPAVILGDTWAPAGQYDWVKSYAEAVE